MKRNRMGILAVVGAVALVGSIATVTIASPGSGVTSTTLVTANLEHEVQMNSDRVKFQAKGPADVRIQKLVFTAGSFSGWHHHPGIIIVSVESGAVTLWSADCSATTYGPGLAAGSVFAEGGDDPVQASSATGATAYVTYVAPDADPPVFRLEDDPPACP
jgi:hypothetical protein